MYILLHRLEMDAFTADTETVLKAILIKLRAAQRAKEKRLKKDFLRPPFELASLLERFVRKIGQPPRFS